MYAHCEYCVKNVFFHCVKEIQKRAMNNNGNCNTMQYIQIVCHVFTDSQNVLSKERKKYFRSEP